MTDTQAVATSAPAADTQPTAAPATTVAPATNDRTADTTATPSASESTEANTTKPSEHMIPKHRFDEVNERARRAEQQLQQLQFAMQHDPALAARLMGATAPAPAPTSNAPVPAAAADTMTDDVAREIYGEGVKFDDLDPTEKYIVRTESERRQEAQKAHVTTLRNELTDALKNPMFDGIRTDFWDVLAHMEKTQIFDPMAAAQNLYLEQVLTTKQQKAVEEALKRKQSATEAASIAPISNTPAPKAPSTYEERAMAIYRSKLAQRQQRAV